MSGKNRLLIFVPGLGRWLDHPESIPEGLNRFLLRSKKNQISAEFPIATVLGVEPAPVAALCAIQNRYSPDPDCYWLRFDPVHLLPDLTAVWIHSHANLDFARPSLVPVDEEIAAMFEAAGIEWQWSEDHRYGLIQTSAPVECRFRPIDRVFGRRLDEVLPVGSDQVRWRRLINESQMIFHQFRAPDEANRHGLGLWFWGHGKLPAGPDIGLGVVGCALNSESLGDEWLGLAKWLGFQVNESRTFQTFAGTRLVDAGPMDSENIIRSLEQQWIQPAWRGLSRGRLNQISLIDYDCYWQLGRFDQLAFWRRG